MNKRLLLLPISLLLLSSCSKGDGFPKFEYRINSVYQTILEEYYEIHKDEYIAKYYDDVNMRDHVRKNIVHNKNWKPSVKDMGIFYSYGEYDGTYVFIPYYLTAVGGGDIDIKYEFFDKYVFYCDVQSNEFPFVFYKEHQFYDIEKAYYNNIISDDGLFMLSIISSSIQFKEPYSYSNLLASAKSRDISMDSYAFYHENAMSDFYLSKFKDHLKEEYDEDVIEKTEWAYFLRFYNEEDSGEFVVCLFNNDELNMHSGYDYQYTETLNGVDVTMNSDYGASVIIRHEINNKYEFEFCTLKDGYEQGLLNDNQLFFLNTLFEFDKRGLIGTWYGIHVANYSYE